MTQPKPDEKKAALDQVSPLTSEKQDDLIEELKLQWLCRELAKADESIAQGKVRPAEEVFARLEEKYQRKF